VSADEAEAGYSEEEDAVREGRRPADQQRAGLSDFKPGARVPAKARIQVRDWARSSYRDLQPCLKQRAHSAGPAAFTGSDVRRKGNLDPRLR